MSVLREWNGAQWVDIGLPSVPVGPLPPVAPADGALWIDSLSNAGGVSVVNDWVAGASYVPSQIVLSPFTGAIAVCTTTHTASTFEADWGAGYWLEQPGFEYDYSENASAITDATAQQVIPITGVWTDVLEVGLILDPNPRPYRIEAFAMFVVTGAGTITPGDFVDLAIIDSGDSATATQFLGFDQRPLTAMAANPSPHAVAPHIVVTGSPMVVKMQAAARVAANDGTGIKVYNGAVTRAFRTWMKATLT